MGHRNITEDKCELAINKSYNLGNRELNHLTRTLTNESYNIRNRCLICFVKEKQGLTVGFHLFLALGRIALHLPAVRPHPRGPTPPARARATAPPTSQDRLLRPARLLRDLLPLPDHRWRHTVAPADGPLFPASQVIVTIGHGCRFQYVSSLFRSSHHRLIWFWGIHLGDWTWSIYVVVEGSIWIIIFFMSHWLNLILS
jgi:hypothetical protein